MTRDPHGDPPELTPAQEAASTKDACDMCRKQKARLSVCDDCERTLCDECAFSLDHDDDEYHDESAEPIGACDECSENIYKGGGMRYGHEILCDRCAWYAEVAAGRTKP